MTFGQPLEVFLDYFCGVMFQLEMGLNYSTLGPILYELALCS
jgi:hypothetical protein